MRMTVAWMLLLVSLPLSASAPVDPSLHKPEIANEDLEEDAVAKENVEVHYHDSNMSEQNANRKGKFQFTFGNVGGDISFGTMITNNQASIPTDGVWSGWSEFGPCSATCGAATKKRERTCHGGAQCSGSNQDIVECTLSDCGMSEEDILNARIEEIDEHLKAIEGLKTAIQSIVDRLKGLPSVRKKRSNFEQPINDLLLELLDQVTKIVENCGNGDSCDSKKIIDITKNMVSSFKKIEERGTVESAFRSSFNEKRKQLDKEILVAEKIQGEEKAQVLDSLALLQAIDGGWTSFGPCTKTCKGGVRTRTCTNPIPQNGGKQCIGEASQPCNDDVECTQAIDGGWTSFGPCTETCKGGMRTRTCTNPIPQNGGKQCSGKYSESCNDDVECTQVIDGGWTSFGPCTETCKGGIRTRTCTNPIPQNGGKQCSGKSSESCNVDVECTQVIDGGWASFGPCTETCKGGMRTRTCTNPIPLNGGKQCSGEASESCNEDVECTLDCSSQKATYCQLGNDNTMCKYCGVDSANCGSRVFTREITDDSEKAAIVDIHNDLRRKVAKGEESRGTTGAQPTASNMNELVWDDEVAKMAQTWADQCIYPPPHDPNRKMVDGSTGGLYCGQNVYSSWNSAGPSYSKCLARAVQAWYDEVEDFDKTAVGSFLGFDKDPVKNVYSHTDIVGHYTQLVWADVSKIGCGYMHRFDPSKEKYPYKEKVVCNYCKGGNWLNRPIYNTGAPASACPQDHPHAKDGLCSGSKTPANTPSTSTTVNEDDEDEGDEVLELDEQNFDIVVKSETCVLVMFYAPWCPHCKDLFPKYDEAAKILATEPIGSYTKMAKVDTTVHKDIGSEYKIVGYPTVKLFKNGREFGKYNGERSANAIVNWLFSQCSGPLHFQLRGDTGLEKVAISIDDNKEEVRMTKEWQTFSYPKPSSGYFSLNFLNDQGGKSTNVYIRGHESQVDDLLPIFHGTSDWQCGTTNENYRCKSLRDGNLWWGGKYTYTLKGHPRPKLTPKPKPARKRTCPFG